MNGYLYRLETMEWKVCCREHWLKRQRWQHYVNNNPDYCLVDDIVTILFDMVCQASMALSSIRRSVISACGRSGLKRNVRMATH